MKFEKIMIVTTSFPLSGDSHSGIFVKRLADAIDILRSEKIEVVVPLSDNQSVLSTPYNIVGVHYLPGSLQEKLHGKGGLPAVLENDKRILLFLPALVIGLFWAVYRGSRRSTAILANWTLAGLVCGLVSIFRRCTVVTVLRGSDVNNAKNSVSARFLLWMTLRLSQKVICVSEGLRNVVLEKFPRDVSKIVVIENGIDFQALDKNRFQTEKILSLVFVGNATKNKNLSMVLEALSELKKRKVDFRLNVIGDGPEMGYLKNKALDLGLSSVTFHGSVAPEQVFEFLNNSSVFINASFSEGRSNSLLEGISSGCLAVVSQIPGNQLMVKHRVNGLLFDPNDPSSLASQLLWIGENPAQARKLALKGRETLIQNSYSWRDCAEKYSAVLNQL